MIRLAVASLGLLSALLTTSLWQTSATGVETRTISSGSARIPVLIELFTSEGCSSCPPADALLERFDRSQMVRNADVIVLSEHVDYWDDIGWKDPYSSHEFSIRQNGYARRFRLDSAYTPQMVVDGDAQFVGSDERRAVQAIENAIKTGKLPVILSSVHLEGNNTLALHIEAGPFVPSVKRIPMQVLLALADDSDQSSVGGGENAGRILKHVAVVRSLRQIGRMDGSGTFSQDVKVSTGNANPRNLRIVAILQEATVGRVLGVGLARLSN